jgi:hypothetical protein
MKIEKAIEIISKKIGIFLNSEIIGDEYYKDFKKNDNKYGYIRDYDDNEIELTLFSYMCKAKEQELKTLVESIEKEEKEIKLLWFSDKNEISFHFESILSRNEILEKLKKDLDYLVYKYKSSLEDINEILSFRSNLF